MKSSENAAQRIAAADRILLILDYDGTITPIVKRPKEAVIPLDSKEVILRLTDHKKLHVCVMSGRSLKDLRDRVGVPGIIYVGNHGLEAYGIEYDVPGLERSKIRKMMSEFSRSARGRLKGIQGVIVDNKGLTVGIHYRLADQKEVPKIRQIVEELMAKFQEARVTFGKMVFEVRPRIHWDKGTMARMLYELMRISFSDEKVLPIYIGDDTTDEDAFIALAGVGVTIVVSDNQRRSEARYCIAGTEGVHMLLQELDLFLRECSAGKSDAEKTMRDWASLQESC